MTLKSKIYSKIKNSFLFKIVIFSIFVIALRFLLPFHVCKVYGESMLPNYKDGMIVVADKVYADTKIERYDVVVSKTDIGIIIKRVVGLPGEEIEIDLDGNILSNGKFLNEWKSYTAEDMTIINTSKYVLAEDEYFLIGDNVNHSSDSRKLGPIKLQNIMGIVR